jgi:NTE family protein
MRVKLTGSLLALAASAALVPAAVPAQEADSAAAPGPARPAIGLVLSGGGARGGAHVGVIKALVELRVPIDYIAGTSIGAAVGGLYASGLSSADLEAFLSSIDWDAAFTNSTPRRLRSFRRKRDDDLFLVDQKPGLNHGEFELPTGLVQGQVIDTILSRVTLPVAGVESFDDLAIPFRAVASDLATGDAVVLDSGDLGQALRASMTVPAALAPIELDGRLLVDGGIAMNLPVEIAQQMGAKRIIAVDVSQPLTAREDIKTVVDVTAQLTTLLTRSGTLDQIDRLSDDDILLRPQFSQDLSSVSFSRIVDTIQTGYDLVMAQRARFEPLALSEEDYAAYRRSLPDPRDTTLPTIDFVSVNNNNLIAESIVENRLSDIKIGEPLNVDDLETALNKVYGLELYQNVRYRLVDDGDSTGLELDLQERSWGPNYLQLGVQYSSSSDEDAIFGLAASYLSTAINKHGGEWRATFLVGDEPGFLTDAYQPLGSKGLFFVAPSLDFESNHLNVFDGEDLAAELRVREGMLELAAGRELASFGEVRGGVRGGYGELKLLVGDPTILPAEDFRRGQFFARFSADTLDDISFPRSGVLASVEWRGSRTGPLSADVDFDQVLASAAYAKTWGRHTLLSTFRYDATISGVAPVDSIYRAGGFFDISGLNRNQLSGQNVARIGTSYYRRIGDLALFPAFAGVSLELGNTWDSRGDISTGSAIFGGSLWAGVDTPIGPIYLGYGMAEGGRNAFYVFLGRVF